jgi:chemotaxis protein methyltransferase CheR
MGELMEAHEYTFVRTKILKLTGVDLSCYKTAQMQRRLNTFLLRSGYANWPAFFRAIRDDEGKLNELRDYLTINVSYFMRDLAKFEALQKTILPELLRGRIKLQVWSAGCSRGHEPYSLAILLAELTGPYRPHQILATDIDRSALAWAQTGGPYSAEEMANLSPDLLARYFDRSHEGLCCNRRLQTKITFRYHDLLAEPAPRPLSGQEGFDLIVCRNVVIYFTPEHKRELYRRLYDALRPGGVLFIGGTEVISRASDLGFEAMEMSFYRRHDPRQVSDTTDISARIQRLREELQR